MGDQDGLIYMRFVLYFAFSREINFFRCSGMYTKGTNFVFFLNLGISKKNLLRNGNGEELGEGF